jgi:hypothetical protein
MLLTNAEQIVKELGGTWHGKFGMVLCPAHADRNPSLSIAQGRKGPMFKCHAGCEFKDIMRALRAKKIEVGSTAPDEKAAANTPSYSLSVVERIWQSAKPLVGTLGQRYLIARGLGMDHARLRYIARCTFGPVKTPTITGPAIIVPMHLEDRLVGLQRIFLDADDRQHYKRFKPVLCSERRAAMQLSRAGRTLALTEGAEDALAYTRLHNIPAWGLPGIEWLAHTAIPDGVEDLIIAFDRGKPAQAAFDKYAPRLEKAGRSLLFDPPPAPSTDWNAKLLRQLHESAA